MSWYGVDPGDLTQDEMCSREPVPSIEPADRAICKICKICNGTKYDTDEKTCWACLGTGDELSEGDDDTA